MATLPELLRFTQLIHRFQQVRRTILVTGEDRQENDVEHSFQLALTAWYVIDSAKLPLDASLSVKYALVHDLVEIYAGDIYFYTPDPKVRLEKVSKERAAAQRLKDEFPEFPEMYGLIESYEKKEDAESRFVYALDKVLPICNIYLDNGRSWQRDGVTLEMLVTHKKDKVALSSEVDALFNEMIQLIKQKESELFGADLASVSK